MSRSISAFAFLLLAATPVAAQTLTAPGSRSAAGGALGFGAAVTVSEGTIFAGRPGIATGLPMPPMEVGAVHLFRADAGGAWKEAGQVTARDGKVGDGFGLAIAVDGSVMVVGAPNLNDRRGGFYVFERAASGTWTEKARLTAADGAAGDELGARLALRGGQLLAAAPGRDSSRGEVRVYRRNTQNGTWAEVGKLTAQVAAGDRFGQALAITADRIVIGAPGVSAPGFFGGASPRSGAAFAYRRNSSGRWDADGRLDVSRDTAVRSFGAAVLADGDEILVGAPLSRGSGGALFRFRRDSASAWRMTGEIAPPVRGMFGAELRQDGADLLVGAPVAAQQSGAVVVMRKSGSDWQEVQRLTIESVGFGAGFGTAVAASGGMAIVGGPIAEFFEGAGYVYRRESAEAQWRPLGKIVGDSPGLPAVAGRETTCEAGKAQVFSCTEVDLVAFMPLGALGSKRGIMLNDIWGWTDPASGREFALVGRLDGTAFVELTDPANPVYLGELPLHEGARPNLWRDIKVYQNHAFIVSDGAGPHGMQVFDLTQLLRVVGAPVTFRETTHYNRIHSAHNIVIDTASGFAYTVGNSMGGETCGGALHMVDIRNPTQPTFAGCYADPATGRARTGYTHDSQCTVYKGPDTRYTGRQICFNASETALGIADVTDKATPKALSNASYPNVGYSHQGWLSEDHRYFFLDDELDELAGSVPKTRTIVWDVSNLEDPVVLTEFIGNTQASDHNLYVKGRYMYQSNYVAGLRVVDISDPAKPVEVGHFDTVPYGDNLPGFAGSWSNYPYFKNGVVAVTSMREGLFIVRHRPRPVIP